MSLDEALMWVRKQKGHSFEGGLDSVAAEPDQSFNLRLTSMRQYSRTRQQPPCMLLGPEKG